MSLNEISRDPGPLVHSIELGESILVVRDSQPLAEVMPLRATATGLRPVGLCKGEFSVPDDFDAPLPEEILRDFEGR